ncbi:MAG: hypothetical protein QM669_12335 [Siphonobacter sp.]
MKFFLTFLFISTGLLSFGQNLRYSYVARPDSVLNLRMNQRELLYKEWAENQKERNAFFGGQSKNDLRAIIETLTKIVQKDNEIIAEVNRLKQFEVTELKRRQTDASQRVNQYLDESGTLMEENKQLRSRIEALNKKLNTVESQNNTPFYSTLVVLILSWAGFYVMRKKKQSVQTTTVK